MTIDPDLVQELWEESIENDVVIEDPYFATSNADYQRRVDAAKEAIKGAMIDRNGDVIDLAKDTKARNKAVNDYAAVVQEFFINRTEDYLKTVGKEVLGIQYYWCRFEFAKGRGQIHAHLLAILKKEMIGALQRQLNEKNGSPQEEALLVAHRARETFGMSAELKRRVTNGN